MNAVHLNPIGLAVRLVFDLCDRIRVAEKGFCYAQLRLLGDQNAVNVPAVAVVIFQNIPANFEVVRGQILSRDRHPVDCDGISAVGTDGGKDFLIRRERRE